ncbi:MAG: PAAR domain-containing protein [Xanthomonadaceae bacterium]|nr:PAAR domain-containing protein [Xanthomonadaceae bacterium]
MQPAARLPDIHVYPMVTPGVPPIPHVGGPIVSPGAPTVLIGGLPAARLPYRYCSTDGTLPQRLMTFPCEVLQLK